MTIVGCDSTLLTASPCLEAMWNALSQQVRRSSAALRAYQRLRSAVVQRQSSAARIVEIDIDQHTQQPMSETHRESTRCDPHKKIQSVAAARSWTDFRSARASSNGEIKAVDLLSRLLQRPPGMAVFLAIGIRNWRLPLPSAPAISQVAVADALCYIFGTSGVIWFCSSLGPKLLRIDLAAVLFLRLPYQRQDGRAVHDPDQYSHDRSKDQKGSPSIAESGRWQ